MLKTLWLASRNVATIILFPGTVTIYIPYRLLTPVDIPVLEAWSLNQRAAMLPFAVGMAILFRSIWTFAYVGKGTLAPFDETRELIIVGLYRYVRNPMYIGVMLILLGQAWFFSSTRLLTYTAICFVIANVLVIGYEENRLRYKYGDSYRQYCKSVGRWIPGSPYPGTG